MKNRAEPNQHSKHNYLNTQKNNVHTKINGNLVQLWFGSASQPLFEYQEPKTLTNTINAIVNPVRIKHSITSRLVLAGFLTASSFMLPAHADIVITDSSGPTPAMDLATNILGDGVTVNSATYNGGPQQSGTFVTGPGTSFGNNVIKFTEGAIFSTGTAVSVAGGNSGTTSIDAPGVDNDPDFNTLTSPVASRDATWIDVTFTPDVFPGTSVGDTGRMTMQVVFSSDEYNEYVYGGFNDSMAVIVNGVNQAIVPNGLAFGIDTINDAGNINPASGNVANDPNPEHTSGSFESANPSLYKNNVGLNAEMDGLTITIPVTFDVIIGQPNTLKIGIADAADSSFDSWLFVKANSGETVIVAEKDDVTTPANVPKNIDLRANDFDLQGDTLTITHINDAPINPGDTVTLASGITVKLELDGTVTVSGDGVNTANDTFTYEITDGNGGSALALVSTTITAADNTPPSITTTTPIEGDDVINGAEAGTVSISGVTANVEDNQVVTVIISDGTNSVTTTGTVIGGVWTAADVDVSGLTDGPLTVRAEVSDAAGTLTSDTDPVTLDDTAPIITGNDVGPTNNDTPALTGTSDQPDGSTVTVTDAAGNPVCSTTTSGGTWTCTPANPLSEGANTLTVSTTDTAGNTATDTLTATIDTAAPTVTGNDVGPSNNNTPALTGTTDQPDGSTVTVTDATGNPVCSTTASGGTWTCTPASALPDGANTLTVSTTDTAGNTATDTLVATIDTTAPGVPTVNAQTTSDTTPIITGTADSVDSISVLVNGVTYTEGDGNLVNNGDGTWSLQIPAGSEIVDGTYDVSVVATDAAGNASSDVSTNELVVDTTAPTLTGNDVGPTNDNTPALTGTTDQPDGSTVTVTDAAGNPVCSTTASGGTWTCTPASALPDGANTLTVSTTDTAGNTATDTLTATIDTAAPAITGNDVGPTNDNTPALTGTTDQPDGSTVTVTDAAGNPVCSTTASGGTWSCTPTSGLPDGANTLTVSTTDTAGNTVTDTLTATIDTAAPAITGNDVGPTNDNTPALTGTTDQPDGSTVTVTDAAGNPVCSTTASGGTWSCTPTSGLPDGANTLTVSTTDTAGNTVTDTLTATIDTAAPAITGNDVGPTNDNTPALTGTTDQPDGSTVTVTDAAGNPVCSTTASGGTWTCTPASALPDGASTLTVSTTDTAGNTSTDTLTATIDTAAPDVPTVTITEDANNDGLINSAELSGTVEVEVALPAGLSVGDTVNVTDGNGNTQTVVLDAGNVAGPVTVSFPAPADGGSITATANITDTVGNTGNDSAPDTATVDITAPGAPTVVITEDANDDGLINDSELSGAVDVEVALPAGLSVGDTVNVTDGNGNTQTVVLDAGNVAGPVTVSFPAPANGGTITAVANITDVAGNTGADSAADTATIDTAAPTITGDDVGPTNDNTPDLTGTTDQPDGSTVTVTDASGNLVCSATVSGGAWSCTPANPLPEGTNTLTVSTTDTAGNTISDTLTATVDTTPPTITGNNVGPTNDVTPTLTGTTNQPDGSTVTVTDNAGNPVCSALVSAGQWSCDPVVALPEGDNHLTASTTDPAGNTSFAPIIATIDVTAPALTANNAGPTNNTTPPLTGTSDQPDGSTVTITDSSGNPVCSAIVAGGAWTCTPASDLLEGDNNLTASTTDTAGNTTTAPLVVTVDTAAPSLTADNVGPTNDTTPTLTGTTDQPDGSTVTITDSSGNTVCTAAVAGGAWSCDPLNPLPEGANDLTATTADDAGNAISATFTAVIDTVAPTLTAENVGSTNDTTPTLTGTTNQPDGSTVTVTDGSGNTVCTTTAAGGVWSCDPVTDLPEGTHNLTATTSDTAGNTTTAPLSVTIDSTAPEITANNVGPTNDATPVLTGTTDQPDGSTVTVTDASGNTICTANATGGSWSCVPGTDLPEGTGNYVATTTDVAGNVSTAPFTATIDVTAPALTAEDVGPTNDTTPTLTGTTDQPDGSAVTVLDNDGNTVCSATVSGGVWSCNPSNPLPEGETALTASTTDPAGNTTTAPVTVTVDTANPNLTAENVGPTNDTKPTLAGTTDQPDGSTVTVTDASGDTVCSAVVSAGEWSCDPVNPLPEGDTTLTVSTTDTSGNTTSVPAIVTVDTTAPGLTAEDVGPTNNTTPALTGTTDQPDGSTVTVTDASGDTVCSATVTGGAWNCDPSAPLSEGDNALTATTTDSAGNTATTTFVANIDTTGPVITANEVTTGNNTTPILTGTTDQPDGSTVTVTDSSGGTVCTAVVSGGLWSCTPLQPLQEGENNLTVSTTDPAGNTATTSITVTVDTNGPALTANSVTPSEDNTPTLTGTTDQPDGSTVTVTDSAGNLICTAVVSGGLWSCTPTAPLPDGTTMLTVSTADSIGNTTTVLVPVTVLVTTDTGGPTITADNVVPGSDSTPTLTGTTNQPDGSTVTVTDSNGNTVCTATVSGGTWGCTPANPLPEGTNTLTASTTDSGGNTTTVSVTVTVLTGDTGKKDPVVTADDITSTNDTTPTLTGTSNQPDGSVVTVTDNSGNTVCTGTVSQGKWSCDPSNALPEGKSNLTVSTTDSSGNTTTVSVSVTVGASDFDGDGIPDSIDLDDDNDGIPDLVEQASAQNGGDTDGDGTPDELDLDSDGDGILDLQEGGLTSGQISSLDSNNDGVIDAPVGANGLADAIETDDTSTAGQDFNNDGVVDKPVDTDGDSYPDFQDLDADNDGINDLVESGSFDPELIDKNNDGVVDDITHDKDGDGMPDSIDSTHSSVGSDIIQPLDSDGDKQADYRDLDSDGDGIFDLIEGGTVDPAVVDTDHNGKVDNITDSDHDGVPDVVDSNMTSYGSPQSKVVNTDGDNVPDYRDLDSDNDSILDVIEAGHQDNNKDGLFDSDGKRVVKLKDSDADGIPDYQEIDSNNDGVNDIDSTPDFALDADKDGAIDNIEDQDKDGIPDVADNRVSKHGDLGGDSNETLETAVTGSGSTTPMGILMLMLLAGYKRFRKMKVVKHLLPMLLVAVFTLSGLTVSSDLQAQEVTASTQMKQDQETENRCSTQLVLDRGFTPCNYAAVGFVSSTVDPEKQAGGWSTSDNKSNGFTISVGRHFKPHWFAELSYTDLGEAELSNIAPGITNKESISYKVPSLHLGYLFRTPEKQLNFYVKGGLSAIKNSASSSVVPFKKKSTVQTTFGAGLQWKPKKSGMFVRLGADFFDRDASAFGLSVGYEFGNTNENAKR